MARKKVILVSQGGDATGGATSHAPPDRLAAFPGARHALRALAQTMDRELSPQGIHAAHPVLDVATF